MSQAFKTPQKAWEYLTTSGGLEPAGRDGLFVDQLRQRLDPSASDVEAALSGATIERFLNSFFGLLAPFSNMIRDLLQYFEDAKATEGPGDWVLVLGGTGEPLEVNLDHFKRWLEVFSENASPYEVLALSPPVMWEVWRAFETVRGTKYRLGAIPASSPDLGRWLAQYELTGWLPLPEIVLRISARRDALGDYASFIRELASALSSVFPNYAGLSRDLWRIREDLSPEIAAYASNEHDRWIQSSVLNLAAFENAGNSDQSRIESALMELFRNQPRRPSRFQFTDKTLTEVLSLPIWKKRYELYSAWIFTQVLLALYGHEIALHQDHGKLKFAFHETLLATVHSLRKPVVIFSEKRVAARDLMGHGRIANIQPDYSAWTDDACLLAVECKHYKRSSTNFDDALFDYSQNLPRAAVLLVNYGPIGPHLKALTDGGGDGGRRFAWGNINPDFPTQLDEFRKTVRRAIGEPLRAATFCDSAGTLPAGSTGTILVIDVSSSMAGYLRSQDVQRYIANVIERFTPVQLVAVDEDNRGAFEPTDLGLQELVRVGGGGTALLIPVRKVASENAHILVLTDQDGVHSLGGTANVLEKDILFLLELR